MYHDHQTERGTHAVDKLPIILNKDIRLSILFISFIDQIRESVRTYHPTK
ncbi:hypothetical protein Plhal304r1_c054g0139531 [Plasmopara halstedii]